MDSRRQRRACPELPWLSKGLPVGSRDCPAGSWRTSARQVMLWARYSRACCSALVIVPTGLGILRGNLDTDESGHERFTYIYI